MMMKKPMILVFTSSCVVVFLMLLSMIYLKARYFSLFFSNICEGIRFWESGNLSNASSSSSSSSSSIFVMNVDDDDDGDDVGVRIQDADIECSSPLKGFYV